MNPKVLFICTGNFYRSRFAEAVFNHHANLSGLPWRAISRGLAIHVVPDGHDLSGHTRQALESRCIELRHTGPRRIQLCLEDVYGAEFVIALDDAEHRPMILGLFPEIIERVRFWDISDLPGLLPNDALPAIERKVLALIAEIDLLAIAGSAA